MHRGRWATSANEASRLRLSSLIPVNGLTIQVGISISVRSVDEGFATSIRLDSQLG